MLGVLYMTKHHMEDMNIRILFELFHNNGSSRSFVETQITMYTKIIKHVAKIYKYS